MPRLGLSDQGRCCHLDALAEEVIRDFREGRSGERAPTIESNRITALPR